MFNIDTKKVSNLHCCVHAFSPTELVSERKPKVLIDLETDPNVKVSGTYLEY